MDKPPTELDIVTKNPVFQFIIWAFFLNHPVLAQEAIQIEIDSAPVEVEIKKPPVPEQQPEEPTPPIQAEKAEEPEEVDEKTAESGKGYGVAIGIGALVAAALAALGGGGGGGGGSSTPPQHP